MRIAIEGCCHGELDKIYETVKELERQNGLQVDLLIICGDFQAVRNFDDLQAMAVPEKYQQLNTFYKYYSREKVAPVLTIFIGGNHEASNYMQELPYGGWVAPNIYYMGYAGIIQIGGVRIGGISGIFKGHDFNKGHFERPPYEHDTKRSVYHVRNLEVFRLKQITRSVDIFISHDWPKGIYHYGNAATLIKRKPFFQREIEENKLGSGPLSDLLSHLQPAYWFAAHLHVKFAAHVQHQPQSKSGPAKCTKFLSLDKCLPRRNFLQVLELPHDEKEGVKVKLDAEWLTILQNTDHLLSLSSGNRYMPGPGCGQRFDFRVTDNEMEKMRETFGGDMSLPENFVHTSTPLLGNPGAASRQRKQQLSVQVNPQTTLLCTMLNITDPNAKFIGKTSQELLDESSVGQEDGEDDSGEDVANDSGDDDGEMPSTIDSSMDVSFVGPANISSRWEGYETANETLNSSNPRSVKLPLVTSTPAKDSSLTNLSFSIQVDDSDDEFLSILSAQKSKSLNTSLQLPSVSEAEISTSTSPNHGDVSNSCSHSDKGRVILSDQVLVCTSTSNLDNEGGDNIRATSKCHSTTSNSSHEDKNGSSADYQSPSLKSDRTSFGMSDLCLDSSKTSSTTGQEDMSPSLSKKRDCSEHPQCLDALVSNVAISGVKKLKRRNVSLYSEPVE